MDYSKNKDKYDSTNEEIERAVPPHSKVLDVGCTTGKLAKALKRKKCQVTGVDIDRSSLNLARRYCQSTILANVEDCKLLAKKLQGEKFDVVVLGDVLEHLKYPKELLVALKKHLKQNALIVSSTPNSAFIWMRMKFLLGNLSYSKNGGLMDEDHLRFYSFQTARALFEESGYEIISVKPSSHGINNPKYFAIKILAKILPSVFAIHILIQAQKKPTA